MRGEGRKKRYRGIGVQRYRGVKKSFLLARYITPCEHYPLNINGVEIVNGKAGYLDDPPLSIVPTLIPKKRSVKLKCR
jgi:hypothetical protein